MNGPTRSNIRATVALAMKYWPNAHLGSESPAEDRRRAFKIIRREVDAGQSIQAATGTLLQDAYRHMDM